MPNSSHVCTMLEQPRVNDFNVFLAKAHVLRPNAKAVCFGFPSVLPCGRAPLSKLLWAEEGAEAGGGREEHHIALICAVRSVIRRPMFA